MQVKASFVDKICRSRTVEINEDQLVYYATAGDKFYTKVNLDI